MINKFLITHDGCIQSPDDLKMIVVCSSETMVTIYKSTRYHNPEDQPTSAALPLFDHRVPPTLMITVPPKHTPLDPVLSLFNPIQIFAYRFSWSTNTLPPNSFFLPGFPTKILQAFFNSWSVQLILDLICLTNTYYEDRYYVISLGLCNIGSVIKRSSTVYCLVLLTRVEWSIIIINIAFDTE